MKTPKLTFQTFKSTCKYHKSVVNCCDNKWNTDKSQGYCFKKTCDSKNCPYSYLFVQPNKDDKQKTSIKKLRIA